MARTLPCFAAPIEQTAEQVVPSLTIYEVFKRVLQQRDEGAALRVVAVMQQGMVIDLDARLAVTAARLSLDTRLPLADSLVLTTAKLHNPRRSARLSWLNLQARYALEAEKDRLGDRLKRVLQRKPRRH